MSRVLRLHQTAGPAGRIPRRVVRTGLTAAVTALGLGAMSAHATTGYFALGYGAKAMSVAGAVVSHPMDSLVGAVNPAGMALVGDRRVDLGIRMFSPRRKGELDPTVVGGRFKVEDDSSDTLFVIPNFGFTTKVTDRMWLGLSTFGNGGMNTTYGKNIYDETFAVLGASQQGFQQGFQAALASGATQQQALQAGQQASVQAAGSVPQGTGTGTPDTGQLGVDLFQIVFAPSLSFKATDTFTVGVAPLIAFQQFKAYGLGNFQCFTQTANSSAASQQSCATTGQPAPGSSSNSLTDRGSSTSMGLGLRGGVVWDVHPMLTLGLAGATKIDMERFGNYEELFAEQGDFDIPANVTFGATFHAKPTLDIMFDYQRIFYEGVRSISNDGPVLGTNPITGFPTPTPPPGGGLLGADNGMGFGWKDIDIYRVAVDWRVSPQWAVRAGVSYNTNPINDSQVLFNILAPAVVKWHTTVGVTWMPKDYLELTAAYMHGWQNDNKSDQTALGVPGKIEMYQNSLDISVGVKF